MGPPENLPSVTFPRIHTSPILTHSVFVVFSCTFHTEQRSLYPSIDTVSHLKLLYKSNYLSIMNPNKNCNIYAVPLLIVTSRDHHDVRRVFRGQTAQIPLEISHNA